jgi:hypothetical protein
MPCNNVPQTGVSCYIHPHKQLQTHLKYKLRRQDEKYCFKQYYHHRYTQILFQ